MSPLRVFLCDSEEVAIAHLSVMLNGMPDAEVIGSATRGDVALSEIRRLEPDLVMLDVVMPGLNGFDVVDRLRGADGANMRRPLVAFVTTQQGFAPRAFDKEAIDFLGKPVQAERLATTLARSRRAFADREAGGRLEGLLHELDIMRRAVTRTSTDRDHLWIHRHGEMVRLDLDEVTHVRAEAEYVRFHARGTSFLHRASISAIERRLGSDAFIRIHRSTIVRRTNVVAIRRSVQGRSVVRLIGGEEAAIGRKYAKSVREAFGSPRPDPPAAET